MSFEQKNRQKFALYLRKWYICKVKETLSTIAERCGVSATTVSRVLSGHSDKFRIAEETARRVFEDARSCGYYKGVLIPGRRSSSKTVGLLIPSLQNRYFSHLASSVISCMESFGYSVIIMDTREDGAVFEDSVYRLLGRNVEGMIVAPCGDNSSTLKEIRSHGIPVVQIDRHVESDFLPYVITNNYKAAYDSTALLISFGHRDIACISGFASSPSADSIRGYRDAMIGEGLDRYISVTGNEFSVACGYTETRLMLQRPRRPTAILSLSNNITMGVLKALRESELKIPEEISLISFDSFDHMDYISPPLTRIAQPVEDMAQIAVKILVREIEGGLSDTVSQIKLSSSLVLAESVKVLNPRQHNL